MSDMIGGAMALYFGNSPSELTIEEKLKRDIATLERDMKKVRQKRKIGKSHRKTKTKTRTRRKSNKYKSRKSNRTMKHRQ